MCSTSAGTSMINSHRTPARCGWRAGARIRLLDESRVRKQFKKVLWKAGVTGNRLYDLRHTFAKLAKDAPITYVAHQLGHSNPATTLRFYARWIASNDGGYAHLLDAAGKSVVPDSTDTPVKPKKPLKINAPSETRTPDPLIKSQLLYQLS